MTQLSRSAQAKLAAEIQASVPAKEWDSIPELKKFREEVDLKGGKKRLSFGELVELSVTLKSEIDYREVIRKDIQMHLQAAMLMAEEESVTWEDRPVNLVTRKGSAKLSKELLLTNGVSADVIAASVEIGPETTFIQIGKVSKKAQ